MICLYGNKTTDFDNNGLAVLDDVCYKAKVTENLKGVFNFEGYFHNCEKTELITNDMILKVPTPKGTQLFRINNIKPTLIDKVIQAKHIAFDLDNNFVRDIYPKEYTGQQALTHILSNAHYDHNFSSFCDITKKASSRLIRKNILSEAILEGKNSFINRWGGEIDYDNFNISIFERRGSGNSVSLILGKNIKGFEVNIDYSTVITEIEPRGFDGIGIDEISITSPLINNYGVGRYKVLKWEEVRTYNPQNADSPGFPSDVETKAELRRLTRKMFENGVDKPTITCKVDILELSHTEEGKPFKDIETMYLGDVLNLFLPNLNIESEQRFIDYEYNPLTESYIKITLGEQRKNIFDEVTKLEGDLFEICGDFEGNNKDDIFIKAKNESTRQINQGCQNSYVVARMNEILIGDNPKVSQMKDMIIMNKNGIGFSNKGYQPDELSMALTIDGHIVADRIDVGTLNAEKVEIVNLNATNITTGTLNVDRLEGITINAEKINVTNINATHITAGILDVERLRGQTIDCDLINVVNINATNITVGVLDVERLRGQTIDCDRINVVNINATNITAGVLDVERLRGQTIDATKVTVKNLSATNITTGTLNGTNVNITNLNASNITTGNFKANLIKTGTISAQGGAFQIQLDNGKISFGSGGAFITSQSFYMQGCSINSSRMSSSNNYRFGLRNLYMEGYVTIEHLQGATQIVSEDFSTKVNDTYVNPNLCTEHYISDIGGSKIGSSGFTICYIDISLQDLINLNCEYHIFTQCYNGSITKIERELDHFVVYGEVGTEFSFELKGKRKQYENNRLNDDNILHEVNPQTYFEEMDQESISNFEIENILNTKYLEDILLND